MHFVVAVEPPVVEAAAAEIDSMMEQPEEMKTFVNQIPAKIRVKTQAGNSTLLL